MAVKLLIFVGLLVFTMVHNPQNWTPERYIWVVVLVLAGLGYVVKGKFSPSRGYRIHDN
jgi:hypothetical protein